MARGLAVEVARAFGEWVCTYFLKRRPHCWKVEHSAKVSDSKTDRRKANANVLSTGNASISISRRPVWCSGEVSQGVKPRQGLFWPWSNLLVLV